MAQVIPAHPMMPAGSMQEIGKKIYIKNADGSLTMAVAVPYVKTYNREGVVAHKDALQAELVEINDLIQTYQDLDE